MTNTLTPRDYCTTPEEAAKIGRGLVMLREIACHRKDEGERDDLFKAAWAFWNFEHVFDDLLDNSNWPPEKKLLALKGLEQFTVALLENPFYVKNADAFKALFVTAIARNIAGDQFAASKEIKERMMAPAIRCADIDVFLYFAHLAGGWEFAQTMNSKHKLRIYDKPDAPVESEASHV
jgi:hypothetical protein